MSEAVHEMVHEAAHEAHHSGNNNVKLIGLLISVLALFLAVSEMLGKSAQTAGLGLNIQASDTWNFFQAKTVRQTMLRTALENARIAPTAGTPEAQKQIEAWQANIDRWENEAGDGRKVLMAKAKELEHKRDDYLGKYHAYEIVSLILQLGIVLASVSLLSSIMGFALASMLLGVSGIGLLAGAYLNIPFVMHLLH